MQKGLSSKRAKELLKEYGANSLPDGEKQSAVKIFTNQFKDFLTLILLLSTVISILLGEYIDSFTIMAIVFLNAVLGFSQEYRTEQTLEKLRQISAPKAKVFRDGKQQTVSAEELVPGDLVLVSAGDKVPADGVLQNFTELSADESLLTGESLPVEKSEAENRLYMGTLITSGHGEFTVEHTGSETEMGKIAGLLNSGKAELTPLQKRLAVLSKYIALGCIAICLTVTATGIIRGEPIFDMFLTGLSLSVAAIPEGLTAVITISLGLAVSRMLKRNALIRRLYSVETLGCADVICSDKTGTLTQNRMEVTKIYVPKAGLLSASDADLSKDFYRLPLLCSVLCNNAALAEGGAVCGEATEKALLSLVLKDGDGVYKESKSYERIFEIPFDSSRKLMTVAVKSKNGAAVFTKGAPDYLLPLCKKESIPESAKTALSEMANEGLRVLALAYKDHRAGEKMEDDLCFLGFFGISDPPRPGARASVLKCRRAGIRTVMITGDHPATAGTIAEKLGITSNPKSVMTGAELEKLTNAELCSAVETHSVFARVTPAHKLKIVRALKQNGHIVAMTGDGVNDAPAVKEADIGVAMGKNGTDVTREAAGIVLLDDDFSTLVAAVEEGRIIYGNIRKFIRYLLACNIGEVVTMFAGMLIGLPVVLLPIHILLVNLVTDGIPAIALSFDPPQDDVMAQLPRRKDESVFSNGLGGMIIIRGILLGFSVLWAFASVLKSGGSLALARTTAFVSLVFTQLIHVFECKSEKHSLFTIKILNNKKLILAVLSSAVVVFSAVYVPFLQVIFKTVALSTAELRFVAIATFAVPLVSSVINFIKNGK